MRETIPVLVEEEDDEDYYTYRIMYKDKSGNIQVKKILDDEIDINKIKKEYKRFILFFLDADSELYVYQEHPWNRSGLSKEFDKRYPYNVFDFIF